MICSAFVVAPGLSGEAAAAPSDSGSPPPLHVNITTPTHDEILDTSLVTVTWQNNIPDDQVWFCQVQLDSSPVQDAQSPTSHVFQNVGEGYHTVKVWVFNKTWGMAYDSEEFIVDLSGPALNINYPAPGSYLNTSAVNVTWSASDPSYISYYNISLDSQDGVLLPPTDTYHEFSVADGRHTVVLVAYDRAGKSDTRTLTFNVDTVKPTVQVMGPANGTGFNHGDVAVSWKGNSSDTSLRGYEIWVDGEYVITASAEARQYTINYADGRHTVTIVAVDQANNTASDSISFFVDTTPLSIVAHTPTGDSEPIAAPITVQFSKEMDHAHTNITVSGVSGTVEWDGVNATFVPSVPLQYGTPYTVTVDGRDPVGNGVALAWKFTTTDIGTISGVVKDNDGNPLAGATVTLDDGQSVVTDDTGAYSFQAHAGAHTLTISKDGWDTKTIEIGLSPGQAYAVSDLSMAPSDILGLLGIVAAIIAVIIVALLIYVSYRRRKNKGPPANARSWKGMEELQKRSARPDKRTDKDDEEETDERL